MFTGIIREIGTVQLVRTNPGRLQYSVQAPTTAASAISGASIAIDGVCQTVVSNKKGILTFDAIDETLSKTTLQYLRPGALVHVEPALRFGDPVDGHLVYGHVDQMALVHQIQASAKRFDLTIKIPLHLSKYCIQGGSICIQGASLTIFQSHGELISVSLIPETLARTRFPAFKSGEKINIEVDSIGKWIEKMLLNSSSSPVDLSSKLKSWGY
jgi:riboflavin synthase